MRGTTIILRLEGAAFFAFSLWMYARLGASWWLFAALFLVPDISFAGYALGPKKGAAIYNLFHTYIFPIVLLALGFLLVAPLMQAIAVIWIAHIGIDRAVAYGLKHPEGFKFTHLNE